MARPPQPPDQDVPAVTVRSRQPSSVRTVPASSSAKPHTMRPRQFNQAQEVADKFKEGQPVIVNLQDVDRDLSRRLIDFASGLCYGLGGQMEKVANGVYLLTPANVEVSAEERRRITERGMGD
jgi:cell division inhibitor SepF